jgi:hypothetical protein
MNLSAFIVIITGILLFFGFIIWMAIYSRRTKPEEQHSDVSEMNIKRKNSLNSFAQPGAGAGVNT